MELLTKKDYDKYIKVVNQNIKGTIFMPATTPSQKIK